VKQSAPSSRRPRWRRVVDPSAMMALGKGVRAPVTLGTTSPNAERGAGNPGGGWRLTTFPPEGMTAGHHYQNVPLRGDAERKPCRWSARPSP